MIPLWRIALPVALAVVGSAATIYLLRHDAIYFLQGDPTDLGEASGLGGQGGSNVHVRLRGVADLRGSLRVGHRDGTFRVVRLFGSGVLAQVPAPGAAGRPPAGEGGLSRSGYFDATGRLWAVEDLASFYTPILRRFQSRAKVTHLLVSGVKPSSTWLSFVAAVAVGIMGLLAAALGVRAVRRRNRVTGEFHGGSTS